MNQAQGSQVPGGANQSGGAAGPWMTQQNGRSNTVANGGTNGGGIGSLGPAQQPTVRYISALSLSKKSLTTFRSPHVGTVGVAKPVSVLDQPVVSDEAREKFKNSFIAAFNKRCPPQIIKPVASTTLASDYVEPIVDMNVALKQLDNGTGTEVVADVAVGVGYTDDTIYAEEVVVEDVAVGKGYIEAVVAKDIAVGTGYAGREVDAMESVDANIVQYSVLSRDVDVSSEIFSAENNNGGPDCANVGGGILGILGSEASWDSESEVSESDFKEYQIEPAEDHAPHHPEEENSKEEEIPEPPIGIFSRTQTRNKRTRKSHKAARRCYTLLSDMNLLDECSGCKCQHHGCSESGASGEEFPPLVQSGTGSNRAERHHIAKEPIGEGPSPEPRTDAAGVSKAALAQESHHVLIEGPKLMSPVDEYNQELQAMMVDVGAMTFEGRERLRDRWMTSHKSLPDELCRSREDMQELLNRMSRGQSITEPISECSGMVRKVVKFEDDAEGVKARVLDPLDFGRKVESSRQSLSPLGERVSERDSGDGWVEIEITIDSGACDTVLPTNWCSHISILQSYDSRRGVEYEVANGETIPNLGERHCLLMSENSNVMKKIVFQTADIHKPLLSVSRCADLGYKCVLDNDGGELIDKMTGESIPIHRRGNLYVMRAWVRQDKSVEDFVRPQ